MFAFLNIIYVILGFYSFFLAWDYVSQIIKKRSIHKITKPMLVKKYTIPALIFAIFFIPIHFYYTISEWIPEKRYPINVVLTVEDMPNSYSIQATIQRDVQIETYEDENHDYVYDGGISTKEVIYEYFWLDDVQSPVIVSNEGVFNELDSLPEAVTSNTSYNVEIYGMYSPTGNIESDDAEGVMKKATISIPPLTKEVLGITLEEQAMDIKLSSYIERAVILFCSFVALICTHFITKKEEIF